MKKLVTAIATVATLSIAAPVFACPNMDHDEAPTPRTADKDKKPAPDAKAPADAKAKDGKASDGKAPADAKAKDTKPADAKKPGDKVSMK